MRFELKDCRTGGDAVYRTTVEISERDGVVSFGFTAEHTEYYCPYDGYNFIHSEGDAVEVLIGSDPDRKVYYEMELSAKGDLMLAKMRYLGVDGQNVPQLEIGFVDEPFVRTRFERRENGYFAEFSFDKRDIMTGDGEVYFNAYRLETDGGEMDKHLFALAPTLRPKFHAPECFVWLKDFV